MTDEPLTHIRVGRAAKLLGVSRQRVYQLIESGHLQAFTDGNGFRYVELKSIKRRLREQGQLRLDL